MNVLLLVYFVCLQLADLQEEMHKKDSRWSATQVRTRDRLKQLEQENTQLKNETEKLKKEKSQAKMVRISMQYFANSNLSFICKCRLHFKVQNFSKRVLSSGT